MIRILIFSLLLSPLFASYNAVEDMHIFDDTMPAEVEEPDIMVETIGQVYDDMEVVQPTTSAPSVLIVDDVHEHPTLLKMSDYQESDTIDMMPSSHGTKIIKYINPQMYKLDLSIPENTIDFWQLLGIAMQNSASIILKNHDMNITKANLAILKSEYYPNLSLNYFNEYYHGFSRSGNANIGGSVYPTTSEYRNSLNLNIDYEVYRFGASDLKMGMGEMDMAILKSEIALEKERIAKSLLENYNRALKAQETIKMKKKILFVKNVLLENTQRLYNAGFASKTDIARLRIDAVYIEKEILTSRLHILEALKNIHLISNVDIDINQTHLAMLEPMQRPLKGFEETAKSNNIKLQIDKKVKEIELIKKDYLPTFSANGAYQIYGGDTNNFFDAIGELQRNNWNIGITLRWDIFSGFKTDNTIQRAKLEIEKLIEEHRLEAITFKATQERRGLLKEMIDKILSEEGVLLNETSIQKDLLSRLQRSGNISIIEVDKIEVSRLQSELDFKLEVINQVNEDILAQLIM